MSILLAYNASKSFRIAIGSPALLTAQNPLTKEVTRLSYRRVHATWQALIAQSSILSESRLHDLRHTFATERVGLMSLEELRALMGHEKIQTTLRYQKVTSLRAEEVAQKALNAVFAAVLRASGDRVLAFFTAQHFAFTTA